MGCSYRILEGDVLERLAELPDGSVHCVVTDPPYHLTAGKKGGSGEASLNENSPAGRSRVTTGFMGQAWDGGDIAFRPETWRAVWRVLKPGGYLLAFGGTRTYHRMVCAIEDAGFEIRDQIQWIYGSGFPKSHNVALSIDKLAGHPDRGHRIAVANRHHPDGTLEPNGESLPSYTAKSDAAKQWEGWGTALKPAHEPIVLARKPLIGTVATNVLQHGTGALNIDGCRVEGTMDGVWGSSNKTVNPERIFVGSPDAPEYRTEPHPAGRWPANVIHDGSEEVLAAFPTVASGVPGTRRKAHKTGSMYGTLGMLDRQEVGYADSGSAARFFYCAKASKEDRDEGCGKIEPSQYSHDGRKTLIDNAYQRNASNASNAHPTVKPTALMRYLVKLVTPPNGTVLDPFAGSGSTGKAALYEGFDFIGIELNPDYARIAECRIGEAAKRLSQEVFDFGQGLSL
jgi:site-specific DNA-methyltransferase (adenine-specific)